MPEQGKKICELRVCDLKDQLEQRELETVGPKAVLIERLEKVSAHPPARSSWCLSGWEDR